jgi:pilus assembly protein CpaB
MQARALVILGIALLLGATTVVLMNRYLQQQVSTQSQVDTLRTVRIVVAAADLKTGMRLDYAMLRLTEWPEDSVPPGAFTDPQALLGDVAPVVLSDIRRGEPVLAHRLSPQGARGGLPARIPEDMRAVTIPVNEIRGVAGFVSAGDFVDVMHTTTLGRRDDRPVTRVILQNVQVLGRDQNSATDETDPKVARAATLLVSPHDGQRIALALATGEISLMLRNEFDASLVETVAVSYEDLLTAEPTRKTIVTTRARRALPQVEVIRGLEVTSETVKEGQPVPANTESGNAGSNP